MLRKLFWIGVLLLSLSACSKESEQSGKADHSPDWQRGRAVFVANCVACHNSDPSKDGPLGPAIRGSAQELIEARVLRSEYPPHYKPKRTTKLMPSFPYLKEEVPYIAAYLR
jgi:mono/diheme cytochrome c family protein